MATHRTTYEAEILDQRMIRAKNSGVPVLVLKTRLLAQYKNGFNAGAGKAPLPAPETGEVQIYLDPNDLGKATASLAVLGIKGEIPVSHFVPAHPKFVNLTGKKFPCYVSVNADKGTERWYVSDKLKDGDDRETLSLSDLQAWEKENAEALKSASEPIPY